MMLNPLSLFVGIVLELALAWWRFDDARRRPQHPHARGRRAAVTDRRVMASMTVYSLRGRR